MSQFPKSLLLAALLSSALGTLPVHAGQAVGHSLMFGIGQPAGIEDLPPGPTRDRLEALPQPARERALEWLQGLEFPAADLDAMQIDDQGGVFYVEPMPLLTPSAGEQD